ncbi:MAG: hypothetical protein ABI574_15915, partial [Burkholderiales bacterium]
MASQPHGFTPSSAPAAGASTSTQGATGPLRRWSPAAWEARLLADSLRSASVVLLHGAEAADRRAFVEQALLPLLSRRVEDHASMPGPVPRALPAVERRGNDAGRAGPVDRDAGNAETVLLLDDWGPPQAAEPGQRLVPLAERLRGAGLSANPVAMGEEPSRVLLILLGFEAALTDAATAPHPDPFWVELAQLPRHSAHDIHLLLVTSDAAHSPGMAWLKQLLPALGEHSLRLDHPAPAVVPPLETLLPMGSPAPNTANRPASHHPPRPGAALADDEWLSSVRQAVRDVAAKSRLDQAPVPDSAAPPASLQPAAAVSYRAATPSVAAASVATSAAAVAPVTRPAAATDEPLWEHFATDAYDENDDDGSSDDWATPVRYVPDRSAKARSTAPPMVSMPAPASGSRAVRIGAGALLLAGVAAAVGWWLRPLMVNDFAPVSALVTPADRPGADRPVADRTAEPAPGPAAPPAATAPVDPATPARTPGAITAMSPEAELNAAPPAAGQVVASAPAMPAAAPPASAAAPTAP